MFFEVQTEDEQKKYELLLKIIGSLSKLATDNTNVPYLYYRMAENIFCRAFSAKNLSRSDISVDASKSDYGIGLKTFLHKNGHCIEKVAEFNRERKLYCNSENKEDLIQTVANLRNNRIISTCGICSLPINGLLYHCVTRDASKFLIHEEPMQLIDVDTIRITNVKDNVINFNDKYNEYSFNLSKSTLFKRFHIESMYEIDVQILDDPFTFLEKTYMKEFELDTSNKIVDTLYLPLYSVKKGKLYVPEKSGLNQWNAAPRRKRDKNGILLPNGKKRNVNDVYIPYPAEIRHFKPDFFPPQDKSFTLNLPNGGFKMAKICQDDGKALMTNPNEDLGEWILRDVLRLPENELVTYDKLEQIGIDTVQINKFEDNTTKLRLKKRKRRLSDSRIAYTK